MPAHRTRPSPPARMVELLAVEKVRLLHAGLELTDERFQEAWDRCWQIMVSERAWPHATEHRRSWRQAMAEGMLPEARACFLNRPSGFQRYRLALYELSRHRLDTLGSDDMLMGQMVA